MKLKVYIDAAGMEKIALGQPLYSWNYNVQDEDSSVADNKFCIATFTPEFPLPEACIIPVLESFKEREAEIQAEAHEEMMKIGERRANLLALTYEGKV